MQSTWLYTLDVFAQQSELSCALFCSDQYDSHDERDDDGEGESVEEHKSVIMHLLSQVRLGMDLTKVPLHSIYLYTSIFILLFFFIYKHAAVLTVSRWCYLHLSWREGHCWRCMQTSLHILICLSGKVFSCSVQHMYTPGCTENQRNGFCCVLNIVWA